MVLPLSAIFMPLAIFILTTFYSQIPDGLEDAARVEGRLDSVPCSESLSRFRRRASRPPVC